MADSKISALSAVTSLAGTEEFVAAVSGVSNKITAANIATFMPGYELDYVQITSNVNVTATTDGNSQGTAIIDGNAVTFSGSTRVKIEVYFPVLEPTTSGLIRINLYDGTTDLGRLIVQGESTGGTGDNTGYGAVFITPSAGAHTYHIRGWKSGGTATAVGDVGGASTNMPAWYRITVA